MDDERLFEIFMDIQRGLPRQGPGNNDATLRALAHCKSLPENARVLDIGCGPGQQTLALAKALDTHVTAVDYFQEFLDQLEASAEAGGMTHQVTALQGDMNLLPFEPGDFDLIWAEGSAYIMGVDNALQTWKPLLHPGGYLALTELTWLTDDPPADASAFFQAEYPAMKNVAGNLALFERAGYRVIEHFTLPDEAWWTDYYTPLSAKLPAKLEAFQDDEDALGIARMTETEIDMRRRFGDAYGYEFFIAEI